MLRKLATPVSILVILSSVNGVLASPAGVSAASSPIYGDTYSDHDNGFSWG